MEDVGTLRKGDVVDTLITIQTNSEGRPAGLERLRRWVRRYPGDFLEAAATPPPPGTRGKVSYLGIATALSPALRDVRPEVMRDAARTLTILCRILGPSMRGVVAAVLPDLLAAQSSSQAAVAENGKRAMHRCIAAVGCGRAGLPVVASAVHARSSPTREAAADMLQWMLAFGLTWREVESEKCASLIEAALRRALEDASEITRAYARRATLLFVSLAPVRSTSFITSLSSRIRAALTRQVLESGLPPTRASAFSLPPLGVVRRALHLQANLPEPQHDGDDSPWSTSSSEEGEGGEDDVARRRRRRRSGMSVDRGRRKKTSTGRSSVRRSLTPRASRWKPVLSSPMRPTKTKRAPSPARSVGSIGTRRKYQSLSHRSPRIASTTRSSLDGSRRRSKRTKSKSPPSPFPRPSSAIPPSTPGSVPIGKRVSVRRGDGGVVVGTVQFFGRTHTAAGRWVGVELEEPSGKNDGSICGVHYFHCKPKHGIFVRPNRLLKTPPPSPSPRSPPTPPTFSPPAPHSSPPRPPVFPIEDDLDHDLDHDEKRPLLEENGYQRFSDDDAILERPSTSPHNDGEIKGEGEEEEIDELGRSEERDFLSLIPNPIFLADDLQLPVDKSQDTFIHDDDGGEDKKHEEGRRREAGEREDGEGEDGEGEDGEGLRIEDEEEEEDDRGDGEEVDDEEIARKELQVLLHQSDAHRHHLDVFFEALQDEVQVFESWQAVLKELDSAKPSEVPLSLIHEVAGKLRSEVTSCAHKRIKLTDMWLEEISKPTTSTKSDEE